MKGAYYDWGHGLTGGVLAGGLQLLSAVALTQLFGKGLWWMMTLTGSFFQSRVTPPQQATGYTMLGGFIQLLFAMLMGVIFTVVASLLLPPSPRGSLVRLHHIQAVQIRPRKRRHLTRE